MTRSVLVEDFPAVHLEQIRLLVGGRRKLNAAESVDIDLDNGRCVHVDLLRRPANLGTKPQVFFACPSCGGACRVLRVIDAAPVLVCVRCLRVRFHALYRVQSWNELRRAKYAARQQAKRVAEERSECFHL